MTETKHNPIATPPRRPRLAVPLLLTIFFLFSATGTRAQSKEWATYPVYDVAERSWLGDVDWAAKWYFDRRALTNLVPLYAYHREVVCTGPEASEESQRRRQKLLFTIAARLTDRKPDLKLPSLAKYAAKERPLQIADEELVSATVGLLSAAIAARLTDRKPDPKLPSLAKYAAKERPLQIADEELVSATVGLLSAAIAARLTDRKPDPKLPSLAKYAAKERPLQIADEELVSATVGLLSAAIAARLTDRKPDPKLPSLAKYAAKERPLQIADEELVSATVGLLSAAIAARLTDRKPDPRLPSLAKYPNGEVDTTTLRRIASGRRDNAALPEPRRTAIVGRDRNGRSDAPWLARFGNLSTLCRVSTVLPSNQSMFIATDYVLPDAPFERLFYLDRTDAPLESP